MQKKKDGTDRKSRGISDVRKTSGKRPLTPLMQFGRPPGETDRMVLLVLICVAGPELKASRFLLDERELTGYPLDDMDGISIMQPPKNPGDNREHLELKTCELFHRFGLEEDENNRYRFGDLLNDVVKFAPGVRIRKLVTLIW
jgi:hypothetical protein